MFDAISSSLEFHRHSSPVNTSFSMLHAVGHTRATSLTHSYGRRDLQRGGGGGGGGAPRPLRDSGGGGDATALRQRTHGDPRELEIGRGIRVAVSQIPV